MDFPWHMLLYREPEANKYDFGHVLVVGGTKEMGGAPILSGLAALRVGAGLVTIASPEGSLNGHDLPNELMSLPLPEWHNTAKIVNSLTAFIDKRHVTTLVVGSGMPPEADKTIRSLLIGLSLPVVLDAECFTALHGHVDLLAALGKRNPKVIITPHQGEFARIAADTPAQTFAKSANVTVVLKAHTTLVAAANGQSYVNHTGNAGLATAGTGDVLSGVTAGIFAQHANPFEAAAMGVWLHGRAGDLAVASTTEPGLIASDIIEALPKALLEIKHVSL